MKKRFCFLMVLFPIFVFCQKKDTLASKPHRFSIGLTFSPDYGNLFLAKPGDFVENYYAPQSSNTYSDAGLCFSTGLNLSYRLSKNVSFQAGLLYSDICYRSTDDYYAASNFYYIGFPVKINCYLYQSKDSKFKIYISAGILTNYFLYETWEWKSPNGPSVTDKFKGSESGLTPINPMAIVSLGFSYDISKKIFITAEPTIKSSFLPVLPSSPNNYNEYFYTIGLNIGIYCRL